ncbi:tRNA 5-methylaminomethyl-2-thiouridine biosynthesis bifunctional protein MnmC [Sinobacterium norvegicum]|uniref:tRNA 5-methylaminomethyl-2-thiouridine biosynthesis bifunctional protein MnmC n=1 Tax=Sinobacterium norvegicum TaxID=1641715 RepID=A0ABM9ACA2_9GAMM|nr:bifunctional tRNA (5-methylaminomethyl-2-thiouridine)(34)-methyltransferase MnmD/FAD-dependent 5-carboxymethylaminomethyl-2-thiouridine(34) oxidoreductase MnmC [Sinobacterium norvegicum]CAH0990527.1 tRNA 5-methylaminomethyl-2-thiouridine biosynthesis bifunctional protein MnmC [Sinobacterium norvegicum]
MSASTSTISPATICFDNDGTPVSTMYDDFYFSTDNGYQESQYTFLEGNQLAERWQQLKHQQRGNFVIAEAGFGSGLNFLAAAELWLKTAPEHWQLHFISSEKHPLSKADLTAALALWPSLSTLSQALINNYPPLVPGIHCIPLFNGRIHLQLGFGDSSEIFEQFSDTDFAASIGRRRRAVDAWFLDGFSPAKNPDMWRDDVFSAIALLSQPGTTLATFTAASQVRKQLSRHGFTVSKRRGYGVKREMLTASMDAAHCRWPAITAKARAPWYLSPPQSEPIAGQQVTVIGAGIAGMQTAYSLANRGIDVTVLEAKSEPASVASGNPQGILYTRLSPGQGELSQFAMLSYIYATNQYKQLFAKNSLQSPRDGQLCGTLQLAFNAKELRQAEKIADSFSHQDDLVQFQSADQASLTAGTTCEHGGLFYPASGWLHPKSACLALSQHPRIKVITETRVSQLEHTGSQWQLHCQGQQSRQADTVVIATAEFIQQFAQTERLPVKPIRGQITKFNSSNHSEKLSCVVCHEGYLTPSLNHSHTIGASFNQDDDSTILNPRDHLSNIAKLQQAMPSFSAGIDFQQPLSGRAGFRCTTPDYLPIVGPVADYQQSKTTLQPLAKNAKARLPISANFYPNLYINIGHGSRGLTSTPLCGELIASYICHSPSPISWQLSRALNPARFLVRAICRKEAV